MVRMILPLIIVLHLVIASLLALKLNLWVDEAYSLHTTGAGLRYAVLQALHFENQPPLYFLLLWAWRQVNSSLFFARLFSIGCSFLTLLCVARWSRHRFPNLHPALPVAAVALNPLTVGAAVDARSYGLVLLLSASLLAAFYGGFWALGTDKKARVAFTVLAAAALYTQYYLAFLLVAFGALIFLNRRTQLPHYLASVAIALAAFVPMIFVLMHQLRVASASTFAPASAYDNAWQVASVFLRFVFPVPALPHAATVVLWCALLALVGLCVLALRRHGSADRFDLTAITVLAGVLILTALTIFNQQITARYAAGLFVVTVLAAYAWLYDKDRERQPAAAALTAIAALLSIVSLIQIYQPMAKTGDWQRVAAYIMQNEKAGEPIMIFEANEALPLAHYYGGLNVVVPVPSALRFDTYDVRRNVIGSEADIGKALGERNASAAQAWLVTTDYCKWLTIDFHCDLLDRFVARHYVVKSRRTFFHSTVRLLGRRGAAPLTDTQRGEFAPRG
ncbi:MAG: hypothetical protein DLM53_03330 [Candidatus Eremiobacter antarcticus]|nr:MAG: hypothetical protein DLM53_03330 [Candidatus Eremiobacter sp. RRmetagenome_bin22]